MSSIKIYHRKPFLSRGRGTFRLYNVHRYTAGSLYIQDTKLESIHYCINYNFIHYFYDFYEPKVWIGG